MNRGGNHDARTNPPSQSRLALRVQSVFNRASALTCNSIADESNQKSTHSRKTAQLVSALSCVSLATGREELQNVVDSLSQGVISACGLISALFDADELDDIETAACLCNLAVLLEHGTVALGDISATKLRDRAVYELTNSTECQCDARSGFAKLLANVAAAGRSQARDGIFDQMLCSMLAPINFSPSIAAKALVLVRPMLTCVKDCFGAREKDHLVMRWARVAALQPSSSKSVELGENDASSMWSTELRGLAVVQKPSDFLGNGKQEEQALDALFKELTPGGLVSLVTEIIASIIGHTSSNSKCSLAGRFPRICVLLRLAGALDTESDTESPALVLEKVLISAICAVQLATDGPRQAMLITLTRMFFSSKDILAGSVRMYERWFLNVLKSAPKPSAKFLLELLQEIVPLEPLSYLKCHMRCFRRVPSWMDLSREYVTIARTRVKDLDPVQTGIGSTVGDASAVAAAKKLAAEEVCKYVAEFHRTEGKTVPSVLVRQMNFHRYSFRNKTLPTLLLPDAEPPPSVIDREFSRGGIQEFDRRRIALIKVLAHERKDRAITKDEADECIPRIEAVIRSRQKRSFGSGQATIARKKPVRELTEQSALCEIFEEFCNASVTSLDFDAKMDKDVDAVSFDDEAMKRWKSANKLFVEKLEALDDVPQGSADILQLIVDRVQIGAAQHSTGQANGSSENEQERAQHLLLWRSVNQWLRCFVTQVLTRKCLHKFWETLKMQVVTCLCLQSKKLSVKQVTGIAVFLFAVVKFSEATDHSILAFLQIEDGYSPKHVISSISEALPLDCAEHVMSSTRFAITYLMLVVVNSQDPVLADFAVPVQGPDGNTHLSECDREPPASARLPAELVMIVQWVLCAPWRLHSSSIGAGKPNRQDVSTNQVLRVLQKALSVTQTLEVFQCKRFSVADWVLLEVRSSWGRPEEVAKIMHKFRSNALSSLEIVAQVACKMANFTAQGASHLSWIILGLSEFACEIECGILEESEAQSKSLSLTVSKCFQIDGARSGIMLVQIVKTLPPRIYFLREPVSHVFVHIQQDLSPFFWPFSRVLVHFLLSAIIVNDDTQIDSRTTQAMTDNPPATFVADLAHFTSSSAAVRRFYDEKINSLSSSSWSGLHSQVVIFRKVFSRLQLHGRVSEDDAPALGTQALGTQAPSLGMSEARRAVQQNPETLALGLLRAAAHGGTFGLAELGSRIEWLVGAIGGSVTADVLDVAVDITAQLPVTRAGDSANGICMEIEKWAAPALRELIRCRITLCTSAQIPYWLRGGSTPCDSAHLPFFVHRIRQILGLVIDCNSTEDESTSVAINGVSSGRPSKRLKHSTAACASMLHITWHARIAAALNDIGDDTLEEAIHLSSTGNRDVGVLPMLTSAIQSVRTADLRSLHDMFLNMKLAPRSERAVGNLISALDKAICAAIERFVKRWPVHANAWKQLKTFLPHLQAQTSNVRSVHQNAPDPNDWYEVGS